MDISSLRIGHGYDVHKFAEDRDLIIGGVKIEYPLGLLGHSDADVLIHALLDSILGAMALGDIGKHFPDTDPKFKGISSLLLAKNVFELMKSEGYRLINSDITVIAQAPKLSPYKEQIINNISNIFECDPSCINVKATTEEGLGFTGRKEGIACHCVCLICK